MSLIEYNVSKEQIDKGSAQLDAVNPSYNYKTDSILGMAANTNIPFGVLAAIFDLATLGIFEIIRAVYVNYNNYSYQQLCDDFAKRQLEIIDRKASKETTGSIFRKSVRELESMQNSTFTELRSHITKAENAPSSDADAIKVAAEYKIQQAIRHASGLTNEEDSFSGSNDDVNAMATGVSEKLISSTEESEMRSGVAGLISGGLGTVDAEAIGDLASEFGEEKVKREVGKQLRGRFVKDREFEKATKGKPADFRQQVENDIKKATAKMKTEVAARQKAISELYKLEKEQEKLGEQLGDIVFDLGTEATEDDDATGYYRQLDDAQKVLDNERIKGNKRIKAENSKKEADAKIQDLEKKAADIKEKLLKNVGNEKKQQAALKKAEGNYFKLIRTHFDILVADDGTVTSRRIRDNKVVDAIVAAGTRNEAEETEEGRLKFHALPTDLSKRFDKAAMKRKAEAEHEPKIEFLAKLRQKEIDRRAVEKASDKSEELDANKKRELRFLGKEISKANAKLVKRLERGEDRRAREEDGSTSSTDSDSNVEDSDNEGEDRRISLHGDRRPDAHVDDHGDDAEVDDVEALEKQPPNRKKALDKWRTRLRVNPT
jgi:hypothetical protein